jgi:hypothetical protein
MSNRRVFSCAFFNKQIESHAKKKRIKKERTKESHAKVLSLG